MAVTIGLFGRCVFLTLIFTIVLHVFSAPCKEDVCTNEKCKNISGSCGLIIANATKCGCCPICINFTEKDSHCYPVMKEIGVSAELCGPQLECTENTCQRHNTKCLKKLTDYEKQSLEGFLHISKTKPHCKNDGQFFRKQCRPGAWCYCVGYEGERIFGESYAQENDDVGCACSRKFHEMKSLLDPKGTTWASSFNFLDFFFRCLPNGDFDPMQCVGDRCFCLNKDLKMDSNRIVSKQNFRNLHCYDPSFHSETFLRDCERELRAAKMYRDKALKLNKTLVGLDIPNCDLDGTYAPKQCRENNCYCADKEGNKIKNYETSRYSKAAEEMKCECARENKFLKTHGIAKQVVCGETGDYRPVQCIGGVCYCVDASGEQTGIEFDRKDEHVHDCNKP